MCLGLVFAAALLGLFAHPAPARDAALDRYAAAKARAGSITDLTPAFIAFADSTTTLADKERVARFHAQFDPAVPGYFDGKGDSQARFDKAIASALRAFPAKRTKFIATANEFRSAFRRGQLHFKQSFPGFSLTLPVYLVHSIGQQDGGTRTIAGRTILFFGADVIADIHDQSTIGPFLDHELLHAYHQQYFGDCQQLWCALWQEGLATYVASRLNPGASDRALLLTSPRPIRPEVEPRLAEAMCNVAARFESTSPEVVEAMFSFREGGQFPPRYGYFVGYVLAAKLGQSMSLAQLVRLPVPKAKLLLRAAIDSYGPCAAPPLTP